MSLAPVDPREADPTQSPDLRSIFESMRTAYRGEPYPSYEIRRARVEKLVNALLDRRNDIAECINADFGNRSKHESLMADVFVPVRSGKFILKHLKAWMRPEGRSTVLYLLPARAKVVPQPLGVVGVLSPWNYPVQLAIVPVFYALAAGNRVMLKPSELTPATSALMAEMFANVYSADVATVVQGASDVGAAFSALPFDHLLYTGSTEVGRLVMQAAAKNLTPVTLELGGKSPVVVHKDFPVARAATLLVASKLYNAGQTCVAPDYVLVHRDRANALCDAMGAAVAEQYPKLVDNADYTSVINARHKDRLKGYVADARAKGATVIPLNPANESFEDKDTGKLCPMLLRKTTDDMVVMQDEIFGPLLPVVEVGSVDEALAYVNARPRPLAMYYFDTDRSRVAHALTATHSGGVTINDCMMHVAEEHLPFGGIGPSGMGAYHGREGFDTFSHRKAVLHQPRINGRFLLSPPYGRRLERLLDWLM